MRIGQQDLQPAFDDLVLDKDLMLRVGTALVSGTSVFLYGPAGTGKTSIAMVQLWVEDFGFRRSAQTAPPGGGVLSHGFQIEPSPRHTV